MEIAEKLRFIRKYLNKTQVELAYELGVSFVTLNSWINAKSKPRQSAIIKIDNLYKSLTGQKIIPDNVLQAKKHIIWTKSQKLNKSVISIILNNPDIYDEILLKLTFNTNSIEGSTLTEPETASVLFKNIALSNKSIIEQMEVKNHQAAWSYLLNSINKYNSINSQYLLKLHSILMNSIIDTAGFYRNHGVRIVGSNVPTANYLKIPTLMDNLETQIAQSTQDNIKHIAIIHSIFEKIHPFTDGNGRIGRLIMQFMAIQNNLPPIIIKQENKQFYYSYLQKSQLTEDSSLLEDFICDALLEGFNIIKR